MNMDSMRHGLHSVFKAGAEAVMPVRAKSGFKEHGVRPTADLCCMLQSRGNHPRRFQVLTPEEFVSAGDYLVRTCPTWSW